MIFKDYYKILGITHNATQEQIKRAYRRLAMEYHPDKNPDNKQAEEKFKEIVEAYDVLISPEKRKQFDNLLTFGKQTKYQNTSTTYKTNQDHSQPQNNKHYYSYQHDDPQKLWEEFKKDYKTKFSSFFNYFFASKKTNPKLDRTAKLTISLKEAYLGSTRIIDLQNEKIRLKIKKGIADNQLLKIPNKGLLSADSKQRGDLFLRIQIQKDEFFQRIENDLYCDTNVDIYTVLLGGQIILNTFKGEIKINIPAGIPYGKVLRIKSLGMPIYNTTDQFGDLYVKVKYNIPTNLSEKERNLLQQLYELNKNN